MKSNMCSFSETSIRYDNIPNSVHSQKISLVEFKRLNITMKHKEMNHDMSELSNV